MKKPFTKKQFNLIGKAFVTLVLAVACLLPQLTLVKFAQAAAVTVDPLVLDHQGLPRDIIKGSFKITNPNHYKTTVFTTTKNFDPAKGEQKFIEPGVADQTNSLATWISVASKMIELNPGETQSIPYEININMRAEKGVYHAVMFFPQGSSRTEAESQLSTASKLNVNLTVGDDSKDRLQVGKFTGSNLVLTSKAHFIATVNNTGNTTLKPSGEVRIYNKGGEEVGTIKVNENGDSVAPGETKQFDINWDKARGFGKYKAQLVMEFGDKQFQTYQDSIYIWLLPWPLLLFIIMIIFGLGLLLIYVGHTAHTKRLKQQEEYYKQLLKQKVKQAKAQAVKKAAAKQKITKEE
jgi:hypothetical protein